MLTRLRQYEEEVLHTLPDTFQRALYPKLEGHDRLMGIIGASGMGKTTLLLQRCRALREEHGIEKVLYFTLDYPFLANTDLVEFAEEMHGHGIRYLLIDEIHKHPDFQKTLKAIYDKVLGMQILFAGSPAMSTSGLGARLTLHRLQGLSFRELMSLGRENPLPHFEFEEILSDHQLIAKELSTQFDIAKGIRTYLRRGYYPGHTNPRQTFVRTMLNSLNATLDGDLVSTGRIEQKYTYKMRRVLEVLSVTDPGKVNLSRIAEEAGISRVKLYDYLRYMQEAGLLKLVVTADKDTKQKTKPARIYIDNTNLRIFYNPAADIKNIRETFFVNQLSTVGKLSSTKDDLFVVNGKWRFQLSLNEGEVEVFEELRNSFRVVDTLVSDHPYRIPLWLFGFLY
jgi:predicted AAA+ superfamily ATPase